MIPVTRQLDQICTCVGIQEEQYSSYVPLSNNVLNSLVVLIDFEEETQLSLLSIRSEATVYLVVYS